MTDTSTADTSRPGTNLHQETIEIEFLYWEDCPSHERALQLLKDVLAQEGVQANIQMLEVNTDEEAEKLRFPGSPTIRINGADIDDNPAVPIGLSCRTYRDAEGKMSPLPSRDMILWAVRQAAHDPQIDNPPLGPA
jgi:hypothetical protein